MTAPAATPATAPGTRRLSDVEAAFAHTHALLHGTTQVTTQLTLRGVLEPSRLQRAAQGWAAELPVLSLRIERHGAGDGEELWFRPGPRLLPGQIDARTAGREQSLDVLLRRELNSVLPTGGPLWRLCLVADPSAGVTHVLFTRNHAISDGHSTGAIVRALLDRLFDDGNDDRPEGEDAFAVRRLAPDADTLTYRPPVPVTAVNHRPQAEPDPVGFTAAPGWEERSADFVPVELDRGTSVRLRTWWRQHGVTVNQFFAAALAESFGEAAGRDLLRVHTAVSLRGRYDVEAALPDVGCFIGVVHAPVRVGVGDLVSHARAYGAATRAADARWRPPRREHAAIRRSVETLTAARSAPGICITNVGAIDPALGPHVDRVRLFRTVVNRAAANYAVVLHLATLQDTFGVTLAFGAPAVDRALVEQVAAGVSRRAVEAATGWRARGPAAPGTVPRTRAAGAG
jgi:hypothetical protein